MVPIAQRLSVAQQLALPAQASIHVQGASGALPATFTEGKLLAFFPVHRHTASPPDGRAA